MKFKNSSNLYVIPFAVALMVSSFSVGVEAAPRCSLRDLFSTITSNTETPATSRRQRDQTSAVASTPRLEVSDIAPARNIVLKQATLSNLRGILRAEGKESQARTIKEVIQDAASLYVSRDGKPSLEKADKMAEVGRKILEAAKGDLNKTQKMAVNYMIAEAILRIEAVPMSEYKSSRNELPVFKNKSTLHIDKFHDLTESYIDGTSFYRDLPQDGGFLSWPEIRGLYTNNSWAIGLRDHDMYHIHYSYGHPYYLAVNMHSSRSINDRRYAMISTLWESVDTFRTGYEDSIANYFKDRNMSAEEGMLYLASATSRELDVIEQSVGSYRQLTSLNELAYESGWRPTRTSFGRGNTTYTQEVLNRELADFINESYRRLARPGSAKYKNFHREGPGHSVTRDQNRIPSDY